MELVNKLLGIIACLSFITCSSLSGANEQSIGSGKQKFSTQLSRVNAHLQTGDLADAANLMQQIDLESATDHESAKYYFSKGYLSVHYRKRYIQALREYNKAIFLLERSGKADNQMLFDLLNNKGRIFRHYSQFDRALETYNKAYNLLSKPGIEDPKTDRAILLYNMGLSYFHSEDWENAFSSFLSSHELRPKTKILIYLGRCYKELADYHNANRYFDLVLKDSTAE